jgi:hypothetical protein
MCSRQRKLPSPLIQSYGHEMPACKDATAGVPLSPPPRLAHRGSAPVGLSRTSLERGLLGREVSARPNPAVRDACPRLAGAAESRLLRRGDPDLAEKGTFDQLGGTLKGRTRVSWPGDIPRLRVAGTDDDRHSWLSSRSFWSPWFATPSWPSTMWCGIDARVGRVPAA